MDDRISSALSFIHQGNVAIVKVNSPVATPFLNVPCRHHIEIRLGNHWLVIVCCRLPRVMRLCSPAPSKR